MDAARAKILILGGTADARELAGRLAPGFDVTLSLAGRTASPAPQPVPVRVGGFGGAEGLAEALRGYDLLVDATHPFAARISANAVAAAAAAGVPRLVLLRPEWTPESGDRWRPVDDVAAGVAALGTAPRRPFAAIGGQEAGALLAAPQHAWLVRSIEPVVLPLPDLTAVRDRGPFDLAAEVALMLQHRADALLCKNSGGPAAAKLAAARQLGLDVVIVRRPPPPEGPTVASAAAAAAAVVRWSAGEPLTACGGPHPAESERGV